MPASCCFDELNISSTTTRRIQMFKTLMTATAVSLMIAGSAMAQDAGGNAPNDFDVGDRAVFVNEDGSMRAPEDIRTGFMDLSAERQEAIRARCTEIREVAKTDGSEDGAQEARQTNAAPGVYNQFVACDMVDAM
jgi:hypothetical protein